MARAMGVKVIQPKSIDRAGDGIRITWQDGRECRYPGRYLRERCPCAMCRETPGHPPPQAVPPGPIQVKSAETMGWYALQLVFSDGHDTGIFTYEYLLEICPEGS